MGEVVRVEASYHTMETSGRLPLTGDHLTLFSEPGKHAFAPTTDWLLERQSTILASCDTEVGKGGLCTPPVIQGYITSMPEDDRRILAYLKSRAFIPVMQFSQLFETLNECLVLWSLLFDWIPYPSRVLEIRVRTTPHFALRQLFPRNL
jgi:hypothetical protein